MVKPKLAFLLGSFKGKLSILVRIQPDTQLHKAIRPGGLSGAAQINSGMYRVGVENRPPRKTFNDMICENSLSGLGSSL